VGAGPDIGDPPRSRARPGCLRFERPQGRAEAHGAFDHHDVHHDHHHRPAVDGSATRHHADHSPKQPVLAVVPNVIGLRIAAAQDALTGAHLRPVSLNRACSKGTLASQSVVDSLALPGPAPNFALGARPLAPGSYVPAHTLVGMAWSGCFGGGTAVPEVVGLTFGAARQSVVRAGLTWTCQDQSTTTTVPLNRTVVSQSPATGTPEVAGALVTFVMARCPSTSP
jgi:hypothetical protein